MYKICTLLYTYIQLQSSNHMERLFVILLIICIFIYNSYNMFGSTMYKSKNKSKNQHNQRIDFYEWTLGEQSLVFGQVHYVAVLSKEYPSWLYYYERINKTSGIVYSRLNGSIMYTYDVYNTHNTHSYLKLSHIHQQWFPQQQRWVWYRSGDNQIVIVNQLKHEKMIFDLSQAVVYGRKDTSQNDSLILEKLY